MPSLMVPDHIARAQKASVNLKTMRGEFVPVAWDGKNHSGIQPIGDHVVVMPDQAAKVSQGGIHFADDSVDRTGLAAESGVLVALGEGAYVWNSDRQRPYEGRRPQPGDRVYFKRYSGTHVTGDDGQLYWLMNDSCIGAIKPGA